MNKPVNFADGLESLTASLGTGRDKSTSVEYVEKHIDDQQLTAAYKTSWLAKKIVDIPATDTFRRWRNWQAEEDQIEKLEALEKKLGLKEKFLRADKLARLYGCCYIYFDMGDDQALPVDTTKIKLGGIRFATVLTHRQLSPGEIEQDALSDRFGKPKFFDVVGSTAAGVVRIDCSRVIVFLGSDSPDDNLLVGTRQGYGFRPGVSVLSAVMEAIKHFDSVAANIASLVFEAKVDVIKVKGLMQIAGNPHEERKLLARYALAATAKGNNGMLILDGEMEEYEQKSYSFAALPDIMDRFSQNASGAADVPMTRLFGTSPGGMNSTGESDLRNYYDHISANQELRVRPALETFDECLIHAALGSRPPEIHYLWASLWQMSDKERSELGSVSVTTIKNLKDTGLIPDEVLSRGVVNMLTQAGVIPGLEAEYDAYFEKGGEAPWDMAEEGEDGAAESLIPPGKPKPGKPGVLTDEQARAPKGSSTGGQWVKTGTGGGSDAAAIQSLATKKYPASYINELLAKDPSTLTSYEKVKAKIYKKGLEESKAKSVGKAVAVDIDPDFVPTVEPVGTGLDKFGSLSHSESAKGIGNNYGLEIPSKSKIDALTISDIEKFGDTELQAYAEHAYDTGDAVLLKKMQSVSPMSVNMASPDGQTYNLLQKQLGGSEKTTPSAIVAAANTPTASAEAKLNKAAINSIATKKYPAEYVEGLLAKDPSMLTSYEKVKVKIYKKDLETYKLTLSAKASIGQVSPAAKTLAAAAQVVAAPKSSVSNKGAFAQIAKIHGLKPDTVEKIASGEWAPKGNQVLAAAQAKEFLATGKLPQEPLKSNYILQSNRELGLSSSPPPITSSSKAQSSVVPLQPMGSEKQSVAAYTGGAYQSINANLRKGGTPSFDDKQRDKAIAAHIAPSNVVVVRGISSQAAKSMVSSAGGNSGFTPGMVLSDKGYVSTTRKVETATDFGGSSGYVMKISVAKGKAIMPVKHLSKHPQEDEFLLPRGSSFKIMSVDTVNQIISVDLL